MKIAILVLFCLYAIQAYFAVDAQKQLNQLREELCLIKKSNNKEFNLIGKQTNDKCDNPPDDV